MPISLNRVLKFDTGSESDGEESDDNDKNATVPTSDKSSTTPSVTMNEHDNQR